jgi:D-3-phosphoglycerate dehydrogenase
MKILLLDTVNPHLIKRLKGLGCQVDEDYQSTPQEILSKINAYQGLVIRSRFPLKAKFIAQAQNLQFIARVGAGLENIDLQAAADANISVFKAPEGNRHAVAEHALGMLLSLFNNLKRADAEVRQGIWRREENRGYELRGKTVAIIGFGYMGSAMAKKLTGFDCRVVAYDKYKTNYATQGVEELSLAQVQAAADVVSLHVPQSEETSGWVNADFLAAFKKDIYLLNTARGKSVVTQALVNALESGKVKGACLDVLEYEKSSFENMFSQNLPEAFDYLIKSDKVLLSPHIAGWTFESDIAMVEVIAAKIEVFLKEKKYYGA